MSDKNVELEKSQEELVDNETPTMYEELSSDERFNELEIEKELTRISKEIYLNTNKVNKDVNFIKGVQEGLELAGFYNALVSCGISNKMAEDCVINKQTCNHNQIIAKSQLIQAQNQSL